MNGEFCVCCGEEIPEGRQVCYNCERKYSNDDNESERRDDLND